MQTTTATSSGARLRDIVRQWSAVRDRAYRAAAPTLACTTGGSGDAVALMLHSSASSGAQWRALWESLESRLEFIAPDLYGYGSSVDWHGDGPLALDAEADSVIELVSDHAKPVHLVGHSYGGAVALKVALTIGDRLRSLTVFEPVAFHLLERGDRDDRNIFAEINDVAGRVRDALLDGDYREGMARFVDYWNGRGAWDGMQETARESLSRRIHKVVLDFSAIMAERTALASYARIDVPTLILSGERSPTPTVRIAERLAGAIPGARHRIIAGVGHMAPLTHSAAVNPVIVEHLFDAEARGFARTAPSLN